MEEDYDNARDPLLGLNKEEDNEIEKRVQKQIRVGFMTKVFGIVAYQMIILFLVVLLGFLNKSFRIWLLTSYSIYILAFIIFMSCLVAPIFKPQLYQKVPTNYIILTLFTLSYSWWIAEFTVRFTPTSVLVALGLTVLVTLALTLYALFTKEDYTLMGGTLFISLFLLIIISFIFAFIAIPLLYLLLIFAGLILFSAYLLYDVQLLIGSGQKKFGEDDYILAAINIYLDIIGIFIRILAIFGSRNS